MTDGTDNPGEPASPLRLGRLNTFPQVRRALVRAAQAVIDGRLSPKRGRTVASFLNGVTACLREEVVESGIRELQERAGLREPGTMSGAARQQLLGHRKRRQARGMLQ